LSGAAVLLLTGTLGASWIPACYAAFIAAMFRTVAALLAGIDWSNP
jgi:hypothetical protein